MSHRHKASAIGSVSRVCLTGSRILLALTMILLAVMPITENFCAFDHFLRGGPDFELTLLCILAMLCLVLLLAQMIQDSFALLLESRHWLLQARWRIPVSERRLLKRHDCVHRDEREAWLPGLFGVSLRI